MRKKISGLLVMCLLLVSACTLFPTSDIKITTESDPKVNFNGYKTYTWLGAASLLNDPFGLWKPPAFDTDAEIKFLIDRELRNLGMVESSIEPDLIVAFATGIDMDALELKTDETTQLDVLTRVPQGALVVVLIDSERGVPVWAGVATAEIQQHADAAMVRARLDYAVTQMIKNIPRTAK